MKDLFRNNRVATAVRYGVVSASLSTGLLLSLAGCGPDPRFQALQQENEALRQQAQRQGYQADPSTHTPLTDASTPPPPVKPAATPDTTAKAPDMQPTSLLPFYPDAPLYQAPGSTNSGVQTSSSAKSTLHIAMLQTPDKPEKVVDFYDKRLSHIEEDPKQPGRKFLQHPLRGERKQDGKTVVTLTETRPDGSMYAVEIREDAGKTLIELMDMATKQTLPTSIPPGVLPTNTVHDTVAPTGTASTGSAPTGTTPGAPKPANDSTTTNTPDPLKPTLPTDPH